MRSLVADQDGTQQTNFGYLVGDQEINILSVDDMDDDFLHEVIKRAVLIKRIRKNEHPYLFWSSLANRMQNRLMITDFFEPSTRTRLSFEAAMTYLGGHVIGTENAAEFSSFKKGESIEDNFKVISGYCDVIVGRFLHEGDAHRAAATCRVPLINGGDGKGEHPTQSLIDLFSIMEKFPNPDGLVVTFVGDNRRSRTVQSLARLLSTFMPVSHFNFISVGELQPTGNFLAQIRDRRPADLTWNVDYGLSPQLLAKTDVVYVTRSQDERGGVVPNGIIFDEQHAALLPENAIILHPLPRNSELPVTVDADPRAYYFEQAWNGLYVRMALLEMITYGTG